MALAKLTGEMKETRANRHGRKVVLTLSTGTPLTFSVTQRYNKEKVYQSPRISVSPEWTEVNSINDLRLFQAALFRCSNIWMEMDRYTGQKAKK